LNGRN